MISRTQKMLIHVYKDAAGLSDPAYRDILKCAAGVPSCADRHFHQRDFEKVMAALETLLWQRVDLGEVRHPRSRYIRDEYHWRGKVTRPGLVNSRQLHKIDQLWNQLREWLPTDQLTTDYLLRIIHKATGRAVVGTGHLTAREAGHLIDALQDRLAHAIKSANQDPIPF